MNHKTAIKNIGAFGLIIFVFAATWYQFDAKKEVVSTSKPKIDSPLPNLQGVRAKEYLETQGLSKSLAEAIKMARYSVNWVDQTPVAGQDGAYEAKNPQQNFAAYFSNDGVNLVSREVGERWNFSLKLSQFGNDPERLSTLVEKENWSAEKTKVARSFEIESQVTKQKSHLKEFFENRPEGLEHSFIVEKNIDDNEIRLVLSIAGDLKPEVSIDGQALMLTNGGGATVLRYDKLKSWDANGTELASRMEIAANELSIVVDDANAVYPVTVDPNFTQVKKLLASDGGSGDRFGTSIAVSGNTAVVGAPGDNGGRGSAYVFQRNTGGANNWSEVKKITASDAANSDAFGVSVAIENDTIVVGAGRANFSDGAIHIFERNAGGANNWGQIAERTASDPESSLFGISVDVSLDTIIVGAPGEFIKIPEPGAVYIFERNAGGENNWGEVRKIDLAVVGVEQLGEAVAIDGETAIIGGASNSSALIIRRDEGGVNNWGLLKILTASDGSIDTPFATSVDIDGDAAVVNAPFKLVGSNDAQGAAYVYQRNAGGSDNWGEVKRIVAQDGAQFDQFGSSVSIKGQRIIVGAFGDDVGANIDQGSAYVFERNFGGADNWGEVNKIVATGGVAGDLFGVSVALEINTTVAGAPGFNFNGNTDRGSGFVFTRTNDTWSEDVKPIPVSCTVEDYFGSRVAISGDTAIVSAVGKDVGLNANQGIAYIFERNLGGFNNWGLVKAIVASDGSTDDYFGSDVAIDGNFAVVTAYGDDSGPNVNQGAAYIYDRNAGGIDNWGEVKKITASDGGTQDWFGWSVAVSGETVIVGAFLDGIGAAQAQGSAYVFARNSGGLNNWGEVKKLVASDGSAFDTFGSSVSIDGDIAVVGASKDDVGANVNQGSIYIFERNNGGANNWGEVRRVVAPDGLTGDQLGDNVEISGNLVVAGAFVDDIGANKDQGSVYVFERNSGGPNGWGNVKKLVASDGAASDFFGGSIDIDGDTVIVGTSRDQIGAKKNQGSAYVFKQNNGGANNWGLANKIVADDGSANDYFGNSVAISGDSVIVGALYDSVGGSIGQGSAYVFGNNGVAWSQRKKVFPEPPTNCGTDDNYGFAVAISGDTAVISATADDVGINQDQGSVYVLEFNQGGTGNWDLVKLLTASDGGSNEYFGVSVAIDGDTVIVGVASQDVGGNDSQGAAYVYRRNSGGPNNFGEVKKLVAADGATFDVFGFSVAVSGDTAVVGAYFGGGVRPGSAYVFRQNQGGADNWGQVKKLTASDGTVGNHFGKSVGIYAGTIIVGASSDNVSGNAEQGSAYIFERNSGGLNNWGETKKLTAADGAFGDNFGGSVALSGGTAVVGAKLDDSVFNTNQGSVYIFERNAGGAGGWGQIRKIFDPDGETDDYFGGSVSISGDLVVVGAPNDDVGGTLDQGSVSVFSVNQGGADNWGRVTLLTAIDGAPGDIFGSSVSVSGDNILIGAYGANVSPSIAGQTSPNLLGGNQQGAGYLFRGNSIAPTAANVSVSGRVATANGQGVGNAQLVLTAADGSRRTAVTSTFGYFAFDDVEVGQTYTLEVSSKRFRFVEPTRVFSLRDELTGMDFVGLSQ